MKFTSDFDAGAVKVDVELNQLQPQVVLEYQIYFKDVLVTSGKADFITSKLSFAVDIFQQEIFGRIFTTKAGLGHLKSRNYLMLN